MRLQRPADLTHEHVRGRPGTDDAVVVVAYEDFLCPFCRRLHKVFRRLRATLGDRLVYVFRHFPNERVHPGAELASRAAEAAGRQGRVFEMHDWLFARKLPIAEGDLVAGAREIGLDVERFERDLASGEVRAAVAQDLAEGRANGVSGTPTLFVDGVRYDGSWDYFSMLEGIERPFAARVLRSARVFASIPTSAGLLLLVAAALAIVFANTPLAPLYARVMDAPVVVGPDGHVLALEVRDWVAEGLLSIFFLIVGLELRREATSGELVVWRAAALPVVAAIGGVVTPALLYLLFARGPAASGWAIPTSTDVAFALGLMAVLGDRVPASLRVFVATLAVVDDVLGVAMLAIFYPRSFAPAYLPAVGASVFVLVAFNRGRVYAVWPYLAAALALWVSLHAAGVDAALAGFVLAACLPTRPRPAAAPLLAQAANALAELENEERAHQDTQRRGEPKEPSRDALWEWSTRNLIAASERLTSPAERFEQALAPWSSFVVLPLFAFSAAGIRIVTDLGSSEASRVFVGVVAGLVVGKPLGVMVASGLARAGGLAVAPAGVTPRQFAGAACLCGVADLMALVVADRAFSPEVAAVAKLAALAGSVIAGGLGAGLLWLPARRQTEQAASG